MKFSQSLSVISLVVPLLASAVGAVPSTREAALISRQGKDNNQNGQAGKNNQGQGKDNGKGNGQAAQDAAAAAAAGKNNGKNNGQAAQDAAAAAAAKNNGAAGKNNGAAAGGGGDAATSTTLDPSVIAKGFAQDGQDPPVDGQSASLTSTNNFINFCVGETITDGKQVKEGSCNPCPIGKIPSTQNMPSSKFLFPPNGDQSLAANTQFTIKMKIINMQTGTFVNAQANYFAAPQQLNQQGQIIGHSHVVVEQLPALDSTEPLDINKFAFFKGINEAAQGGVLTADVTDGLPAGSYRVCSINSSSNHQPAIVPIAQHGAIDDCSYFTVGGAGGGKDNGAAAAAAAAGKNNGAGKDNGAAAAGKDNGAAAAGKDNGAAAAGKDNGAAAAGKDNGAAAGKDNGAAAGKDNGAAAAGKQNGQAGQDAAAGKQNGQAGQDAAAGKQNGQAGQDAAAAAGKNNGGDGKNNGQAAGQQQQQQQQQGGGKNNRRFSRFRREY